MLDSHRTHGTSFDRIWTHQVADWNKASKGDKPR